MTLTQIALKMVISLLVAYWVYKDSTKNKIKYSNFWVILSFIFTPAIIIYYIYKITAGKKTTLSKRQLVEIEVKKRRAAELKKIAEDRNKLEEMEEKQKSQNKETLAEIEAIKAQRTIEKKRRLQELREERLQQQQDHAKQMKLSREAAQKSLRIDE